MFMYFLRHYVRGISRHKLFSFITITGLAFGIAFMILIGQFVYYEFNCNNDLKNVDNIYRLVDTGEKNYNVDYRIKDQMLGIIPGIKNVCLLNQFGADVQAGDKFFQIKHMLEVDSSFFKMFHLSFIAGNSKQALSSIDHVVLTETMAKKIFGSMNVVGKSLRLNHQCDMLVAGVVRDLPKNLSFDAELFVSFANAPQQKLAWKMASMSSDGMNNEYRYPFNIFVELEKNIDIASVGKQISSFHAIDKYRYPKDVILTPFQGNYFNTEYNDSDLRHGNLDLIQLLSAIGVIVLLLAIVNLINLTTAGYRYRLIEFGIKKCLGADRRSLIKQFLGESLFTCVISSLLGILLSSIFLPYFNQFIDKPLQLQVFTDFRFLILFIGFILSLSAVIGIFSSLLLSKISPLELFQLNAYLKGTGKKYRNVLTMFQFSITIAVISGLMIISQQINFVKHKDLGFNTDKLLHLNIHYTLSNRIQALTDKLQQYHGMKYLTKTFCIPGDIRLYSSNYETIVIDSTSLKTFGFKVIKGRNLLPGDENKACFINETAYRQLKDKDFQNQKINGCNVIGVVSDFHYSSLNNKIGPLLLWYCPGITPNTITMRVSGPIGETVRYINNVWKEICPDYPIELDFYDESFASMYKKEENLAVLISIFSILAVVISCMGIFGLSVFQSEQKIKEIGIRKVLGASVLEIVLLLIRSFTIGVFFANIIAWPVAYYVTNKWLQNYAYRIDLTIWPFLSAGVSALVIALLTVSWQAIRSATANPVEALRNE